MDKLVIKYRKVEASGAALSYIWIIIIVAIVAIFIPFLWIFVIMALVVLPIQYYEDKKQQAKFKADLPALILSDYILEYEGKTVDLSQMDKARFYPYDDEEGLILIYRKGKIGPVIKIYPDNMLYDKKELLSIIQKRIEEGKKSRT